MKKAFDVALDHKNALKLHQIAHESGVSVDQVAQAMIEAFLEQTNNVDKQSKRGATHFRAKKGPKGGIK